MKKMNMSTPRIIISGGGTGGHIFPAIAIANRLKEENIEYIDYLLHIFGSVKLHYIFS